MKLTYILIAVLALVVAGGGVYLFRPEPNTKVNTWPSPEVSPMDNTVAWPPRVPGMEKIDPINEVVRVTFKTSQGDIKLALDGARAPLTVGNFVYLAENDFYDGTTWHRVIPEFMIQGGDPFSKENEERAKHGTGGPGYEFPDEINAQSYGLDKLLLVDVIDPQQTAQLTEEVKQMTIQQFYEAQGYQYTTKVESLPLQRGIIAMANSGPNTNGSQFFIITAPSVKQLEGKHTPFGAVEEGMDVVDKISLVERDQNDNPLEPVVINEVIVERGGANGLEMLKPEE